MKLLSGIKKIFSKKGNNHIKIVAFVAFVIGNLAALSVATLAWFGVNVRDSVIDMVTGDLDVEVNKVTAYKYVYPYYPNSTEFINYDTDGVVKQYVIEDHVLTYEDTDVDDIAISSDNATIALGTRNEGTFTTDSASATSKNVCVPSTVAPAIYKPEFRYYLIGDGLFCGVNSNWSITDSPAFALRESVTNERAAVLQDVVVSAGSSFALLEVLEEIVVGNVTYSYNYFPIYSITESASPFRVIDDDSDGHGDRLLCLRSGIYTFTYSPNQLSIELRTQNAGAKKDISVITNNSLDPTKISIDYAGHTNKNNPSEPNYFPDISDYMPTAIYEQNTTLVLDVELNFKNANPVDASLKIERTTATSNSIYNITDKYEDETHFLNDATLRASDFYNFYAKFTKTPYATTEALWTDIHHIADSDSQKFANDTTYDRTIDCTLVPKDLEDSLVVDATDPESLTPNIYHCYIAIEYDYEHCEYFLNKNRLGKTYILDRDFGFHFSGIQHLEEGA